MTDRRNTRHRLTRLGVQVLLIGMFGILGGSLNGLNLLVVVAAVTLAALIAQWRLSLAMINSLRIDRRMPGEAFAGKPMRIRYQINNEHRLMPLWLIRLEDTMRRIQYDDAEPVSSYWHAAKATVHQLKTITGVGLLMPGQTTSAYFDVTARHRGRYRFSRWLVSTNAPLALSTAYRESLREGDYIDVYPRLVRLQRSWQRMLPSRIGNVSATVQRQGPSDDVFFGLREYRHGDSPKHIHWRTTARLGEPAVRQFEQQRRFDICLLVDAWSALEETIAQSNHAAPGSTLWGRRIGSFSKKIPGKKIPVALATAAASGADTPMVSAGHDDPWLVDDQVERAISLAATIAIELTHGSESRLLLVVAGRTIEVISSGSSFAGRKRMLQSLARVTPNSQVSIGAALWKASAASVRLPDLVVISSRSQSRAAAADVASAAAIRNWKTRTQVSWIDVSDKESNQWMMEEPV